LSLVEVRHVSCLFHRPDGSVLCAIDDVSLDVPRGRTVAVIGESG
jgi:ABC-type oligopeptide transport system ATPase subunit